MSSGGKYVVKLPFKTDCDILPDNYRLSENRLNSLLKKFEKQPENLKIYDKLFKEYERDGIIEKVPPDDVGEVGSRGRELERPHNQAPAHPIGESMKCRLI